MLVIVGQQVKNATYRSGYGDATTYIVTAEYVRQDQNTGVWVDKGRLPSSVRDKLNFEFLVTDIDSQCQLFLKIGMTRTLDLKT